MKRLTLTPKPGVTFHLPAPKRAPIQWERSYRKDEHDLSVLYFDAEIRRQWWRPSYWLLWLRVFLWDEWPVGTDGVWHYVARFEVSE